MGSRPENEVIACINRDKLHERLGNVSLRKFHEILVNEHGLAIRYQTLVHMVNNNGNWMLTYALVIAKALDCSIEDIFVIKSVSNDDEDSVAQEYLTGSV